MDGGDGSTLRTTRKSSAAVKINLIDGTGAGATRRRTLISIEHMSARAQRHDHGSTAAETSGRGRE